MLPYQNPDMIAEGEVKLPVGLWLESEDWKIGQGFYLNRAHDPHPQTLRIASWCTTTTSIFMGSNHHLRFLIPRRMIKGYQ